VIYARARALASAPYGRLLQAIYAKSGLPWKIHDEVVRIDPGARRLVPHAPEPPLFDFLRRTIRPGDIVLDVGAFVGVYAVLAARWSRPGGRVVALEPTPSSAALARKHAAFNRVDGATIELVEAAASDRPGRATLHEYDARDMPFVNSLARAADTDLTPATRDVALVTIDDVCRERGIMPTVIRMDVQGAEVHALRGARETIRLAPSLCLVVEMHPQCWPAFGVTEQDARETVRDLGLDARPLVPGEPLFARDTHAVLTRAGESGP
jgi:FkbM family methyltransferase